MLRIAIATRPEVKTLVIDNQQGFTLTLDGRTTHVRAAEGCSQPAGDIGELSVCAIT